MARIAIGNMFVGFAVIFFCACAGAFIAFDTTEAFLKDPELLNSWKILLERSAHGHANLFGILHIALGLTMPYSPLSRQIKIAQSCGLGCGTFAMAVLITIRGSIGPSADSDTLGLATGAFLGAGLVAIGTHCYGLGLKIFSRS